MNDASLTNCDDQGSRRLGGAMMMECRRSKHAPRCHSRPFDFNHCTRELTQFHQVKSQGSYEHITVLNYNILRYTKNTLPHENRLRHAPSVTSPNAEHGRYHTTSVTQKHPRVTKENHPVRHTSIIIHILHPRGRSRPPHDLCRLPSPVTTGFAPVFRESVANGVRDSHGLVGRHEHRVRAVR